MKGGEYAVNMQELKKISDSENFAPIYIFYGEETFLSAFYSKRLCDNVNSFYGMADFNFSEFEGDRIKLETLVDTVEAMPMFAEKKCVLVKDFPVESFNSDDISFITDCLKNSPESTVLIFVYHNILPQKSNGKWSEFFDAIASNHGVIAECSKPSHREMVLWLRKAAELNNATLSDESAEYLLERCGTDMRALRNEITKLSAFADGEILPEHIDSIAIKNLDANVYDMVKCVTTRRFTQAFTILSDMLDMGIEGSVILGTLSGAFADIYRAKVGKDAGKTAKEIAADFGIKREFRITNAMRDASRFTDEYIYKCIEAVAAADAELKSYVVDEKLVFEKLFAVIAEAGVKKDA